MRRVGVEEAAAVGAEHLDRFLRGHRPHGQGLRPRRGGIGDDRAGGVPDRLAGAVEPGRLVVDGLQRSHVLVGGEVLDAALADQDERVDQGNRQQDVQRDAREVHPGVADARRRMAREAADQRDGDGDAGGGGKEVLHREREHLRQVAHRRLAGVALPVGVRHETDGRVERRVRGNAGHVLRIERQPCLQALQRIDGEHADGVEQDDGQGVAQPVHLLVRPDAAQAVQRPLGRADEAELAGHHLGEVDAHRLDREQQDGHEEAEQRPGVRGHEKSSGLSSTATR